MKLFWTIVAAILAVKVIEFAAAFIAGIISAVIEEIKRR